MVVRVCGEEGIGKGRAQRIFRAVELFYRILSWWIHAINTFVKVHKPYKTKSEP